MAAVVESSSSSDAPSTPKAFTPNDFVHSIVGKSVVVKLNSGVAYHGVLACLDGFMNLALEQCEEYVDGQRTKSFGDCFIRGNNGTCYYWC
jgi:U6 snRNA-associated Sm-like protein LSm6